MFFLTVCLAYFFLSTFQLLFLCRFRYCLRPASCPSIMAGMHLIIQQQTSSSDCNRIDDDSLLLVHCQNGRFLYHFSPVHFSFTYWRQSIWFHLHIHHFSCCGLKNNEMKEFLRLNCSRPDIKKLLFWWNAGVTLSIQFTFYLLELVRALIKAMQS